MNTLVPKNQNIAVAEFIAMQMFIERGGFLPQQALAERLELARLQGVLKPDANATALAADVHRNGSFVVVKLS